MTNFQDPYFAKYLLELYGAFFQRCPFGPLLQNRFLPYNAPQPVVSAFSLVNAVNPAHGNRLAASFRTHKIGTAVKHRVDHK